MVVGAEAGGFDDLKWRDNVKARAAKLKLPNGTAFVFPQLIPVAGGKDGKEIVDVRLVYEEDLTGLTDVVPSLRCDAPNRRKR